VQHVCQLYYRLPRDRPARCRWV